MLLGDQANGFRSSTRLITAISQIELLDHPQSSAATTGLASVRTSFSAMKRRIRSPKIPPVMKATCFRAAGQQAASAW